MMTYYTINIEIKETPSSVLQEMKDGATRWGKMIGKRPVKRHRITRIRNQYYMKVGYAS
tara:strand:+ start:456 stop:632 length:177 start_codon:yes stop_codon:yes gene_type:complete